MPTSWSGKAVTRSGAERRTCRLSYRRSSVNDCVGRAKGEFVVKSKYAAFAALDPFFDVIQRGLAGLVDGEHYFDTIADDAVFEFREIVEMEPILKAYIHEAIEVEKAGLKVNSKKNPEP